MRRRTDRRTDRRAAARSGQRGMTLIEVLVAMVVLGTAVASLLALVGQHTRNIDAMRTNMLSRIAAENVMVDTMLSEGRNQRDEQGVIEAGGRSFDWEVDRAPAPIEGLEAITVIIRDPQADDRVLATLSTLRPESPQ